MRFTQKIVILVMLQIALIITSFFVIVYFESQNSLTGNRVNVAGKNRVLTILVQTEVVQNFYERGDDGAVSAALGDLEENIVFLRDGGQESGIEIPPLPAQFVADWDAVWGMFTAYDATVKASLGEEGEGRIRYLDAIRQEGAELVALSDTLTAKLGNDVDVLSYQLVLLQIALGIANVGMHVFMIMLILRIFRRHTEQKMAVERFATIGEFAALVAHDLKNPLGTIMNSMITIRGRIGGADGTAESECARIDRCISRMSHQIYGVLNYARDIPLILTRNSMREIIDRALDTVTIPEDIRVTLPNNDVTVTCDMEKMEFVFTNLVLNAVQAIDGSGRIEIRLVAGGGTVIAEVENSGPSVPSRDISRIFEPLFTTKMQGTGLGLVSCKKIVERHGGEISMRNDPVTFTISIPEAAG